MNIPTNGSLFTALRVYNILMLLIKANLFINSVEVNKKFRISAVKVS